MQQNKAWNPLGKSESAAPDNALTLDYTSVFTSPAGERVLDDLIIKANNPSISNTDIDPNTAIWILARQNLLQFILGRIESGKSIMARG